MGAWGTGIFADDSAADLRDDYRGLIGDGVTGPQATDKLIGQWAPQGDPALEPVFWLALALTQWSYGRPHLQFTSARAHAWLSSLALVLAGVAYTVLQIRLKPNRRTLVRRLLLAGTFILWAIDQILPSGRLAMVIGDAVVSAYVLDLFWIIQEQEETGGIGSGTSGEV
jgi:hypothetical protein